MSGGLRGLVGHVRHEGRPSVLPVAPPVSVSRQATPVRLPPIAGDTKEIKRKAAKVKALVLADCSGSEYGPQGDPQGIRFAAARALLQLMRGTGGGEMAVVHWGSRPVATLALTDVRSGFRGIDNVLVTDPGNMGGNDCPAALRLARQLLSRAAPDDIPLVLVVTDGLEPVTADMAAAVDALPPGSVYLLLVPGTACDESLAAQWQALALGGFERLPNDNRLMAQAVGSIYAAAVGGVQPATRDPRRSLFTRRIR